jgi:hypothetical protein
MSQIQINQKKPHQDRDQNSRFGLDFRAFVAFAFVSIPWGNREIDEEGTTWAKSHCRRSRFGSQSGHDMARRRAISLSLSLCPRHCFFFSLLVLYFVTVFGGYGVWVWVFDVCFGFRFWVVMVFLSLCLS